MDFKQIEPEIRKYLEKVKAEVKIEKAVVFGSMVREDAVEKNDVDLLVISDDFSRLNFDERMKFLYRKSVGFPYDLHVHGITREEFDEASPLTTLGLVKAGETIEVG